MEFLYSSNAIPEESCMNFLEVDPACPDSGIVIPPYCPQENAVIIICGVNQQEETK